MLSWVIGGGGLLGHRVEVSLAGQSGLGEVWHPTAAICWDETKTALADLRREGKCFLRRAAGSGQSWRLLWCAGAGVVATPPEKLADETLLVRQFLAWLTEELSDEPELAEAGALFFSSSAGGVYAASADPPPYDEFSSVGALAPYGFEKLAQEELFIRAAETCGIDLLIGRFSNLYGPGQKLSKPQGLVAHIGQAALRREPVLIYVPLDTIRDYLFAEDAGRMVVASLRLRDEKRRMGAPCTVLTKIFASEVETTVASVLGAWRQTLRRPARVAMASSPMAQLQPRILSFRSRAWPEVRDRPTLLLLGINAVHRDQLSRLANGLGQTARTH